MPLVLVNAKLLFLRFGCAIFAPSTFPLDFLFFFLGEGVGGGEGRDMVLY